MHWNHGINAIQLKKRSRNEMHVNARCKEALVVISASHESSGMHFRMSRGHLRCRDLLLFSVLVPWREHMVFRFLSVVFSVSSCVKHAWALSFVYQRCLCKCSEVLCSVFFSQLTAVSRWVCTAGGDVTLQFWCVIPRLFRCSIDALNHCSRCILDL